MSQGVQPLLAKGALRAKDRSRFPSWLGAKPDGSGQSTPPTTSPPNTSLQVDGVVHDPRIPSAPSVSIQPNPTQKEDPAPLDRSGRLTNLVGSFYKKDDKEKDKEEEAVIQLGGVGADRQQSHQISDLFASLLQKRDEKGEDKEKKSGDDDSDHSLPDDKEDGVSLVKDISEQLRGWQTNREKDEDLKARIRAKQASLSHRTEEEIPVLSILQYLVREIKKMRLYRTLPIYLLFMISLVTVSALTRFEGTKGTVYHHNLGVRRRLLADKASSGNGDDLFFLIDSRQRYYDWLQAAVEKVWDDIALTAASQQQSNNINLGYLFLRQWRVLSESGCVHTQALRALSPKARQFAATCVPAYSSSLLSSASFGIGNVYQSNQDIPFPFSAIGVDGALYTYDELGECFTVLFDYSQQKIQILSEVAGLQQNNFIDEQTRALSVGMITFNQADSTFIYVDLVVEVTESGIWLQALRSTAFSLFSLDTAKDYFILILDILILLFLVRDAIFLVVSVKQEQELNLQGYFTIGNWNTFIFVFLLTSGFYYYYRIRLWVASFGLGEDYFLEKNADYGGDSEKAMMQYLCDYSVLYHRCFTFLSATMCMSWLRLFSFVQYNERVTTFTDSVKLALTPLVSLGMIFLIVLLGFSLGGHVLYGHEIDAFRDVLKTSGTLSRALVDGSIEDYAQMAHIHEFFSAVYFTAFFIFTWILILNMVIAVLVVTYSAIQEQRTEESRWDIMVLMGELKRWWLKLRSKHLYYLVEEDDVDYGREENYLSSRVQAVLILKEWFFSDDTAPEYISAEALRDRIGGPDGVLCTASLDQIFRKASRKQAIRSHAIRIGERWASQVTSRTRGIETSLSKLQSYPLDKIDVIAGSIKSMEKTMEKTADTVTDLRKNTESLAKELKEVRAATSSTSQAMQTQYGTEVQRLQTELRSLDDKNRRLKRRPAPSPYDYPYSNPSYATTPIHGLSTPPAKTALLGSPLEGPDTPRTASRTSSKRKSSKKKSKKSSKKKRSKSKKGKKKAKGGGDATWSLGGPLEAHDLSSSQLDAVTHVSSNASQPFLMDPGLGWEDDAAVVAPPVTPNPLLGHPVEGGVAL